MRRWHVFNLFWIVLVASCVTVNVYFPAGAVQKAADQIVEDVQGKEQKPATKPEAPSSFLERIRTFGIGPRAAYAAEINVEVSTPAIRALRAQMKETFQALKPFYERGAVGETNLGLVDIRDTGSLSLKEKADVKRLVDQKNKERMSLYNEIVTANKFGPEGLPQVQKIFANSWRSRAPAGRWVQGDNGAWEKKK
jgi:uncharacterized protein YdbL (DUF1318 family)